MTTHVDSFLPLKPLWLPILLSLAAGEQYGSGIMRYVPEPTTGRVRLRAATLYGWIGRLIEAGLIEESPLRPVRIVTE